MYSKFFKDKKFLNDCLKFASTKTASKNITDIYLEFFKMAAEDGGFREMLDLPTKQIREILGRPGKYEDKKYEIQKILKDNFALINYVASERTSGYDSDTQDRLQEFMAFKFIDYLLNSFLERYVGANSKEFSLDAAIKGAIAKAISITKLKQSNPSSSESLEGRSQEFGEQIAAPEQKMFDLNSNVEAPIGEQLNKINNLFDAAYSNTTVPLLGIYLRNLFGERLHTITKAYKSGQDVTNDVHQLNADINSFFNQQYYKKKYYGKKDKRKGQKQEFTLQEFEKEFLQDSDLKKELDDISKYVIQSENYEMPKPFREALKDPNNRSIVETVIKQLIFAFVVRYTALHHGVSLPGSGKRFVQGTEKAAKIEFGRDILKPLIENAFHALLEDPNIREEMVAKALSLVGKTEFGQFKSTDYTTDHATYMAMHGLIEKARQKHNNSFANMDENQVNQLVDDIYHKLHNTEAGHMPHFMRRESNPAFFTIKKPAESELEIKNNIRNEINQIVNKDSIAANVVPETPPAENKATVKESIVNALIQKYAKNTLYC